MWRSQNFPDPGFERYTVPGAAHNIYNESFTLWTAGAAPVCRFDANCDGDVNFLDINPFVLAISDFPAWRTQYPNCPLGNVDLDGNGTVGFEDINIAVEIIQTGGGPCR